MPITFVKSGRFLEEREKLEAYNSRLFRSAVDFAEASLWLIAGDQVGQALVMLDNAIEVALKGELERIHRILITDKKALEKYETLKSLLRDAFLNHPTGRALEIPEFDIEKTIYFEEAFDRVAELYPGLKSTWRKQLISAKGENQDSLHTFRNSIIHYGGKPELEGRYAERIVDTAFPFLKELFDRVTGGSVSLPFLLKEWIYREVEVAQSVLRDLRTESILPKSYALKTLQHHMIWTHTQWPSPRDDLDVIDRGAETEWERYIERQKVKLFETWDEDLTVEIHCPVCDSNPGDGSFIEAQVLLENESLDRNILLPVGFNCFVCDLNISPKERFLAQHFVGQLPEDVVTSYLKDIGQL